MKSFFKKRTENLITQISEVGIMPYEAISQIQQKQGHAYDIFIEFNKVGGDDFFQEILTCSSFIDFLGHKEVNGVAFPIKNSCLEDIHLNELKKYLENDSEYDFLIKQNGSFINFQLKSAPEKYISEFNSEYFIKDIMSNIKKYADLKMVLLYLLQPSFERTFPDKFYKMIDEVCTGIGINLKIRNIFFVGRLDLQTYEYTQVYQEVIKHQIDVNETIYAEIRNLK